MLEQAKERYSICRQCPEFKLPTRTCNQCGCFMPAKVLVPFMSCPAKKW